MVHPMRLALACLVVIAGTGLAQDKDKDKPKDKPAETKEVKTPDALIGKWKGEVVASDTVKVPVVLEFKKDGKMELSSDNKVVKGTYKFTAAELMEVEYGEAKTKEEIKVKIDGDKLVLTGKNKPQEFERVK